MAPVQAGVFYCVGVRRMRLKIGCKHIQLGRWLWGRSWMDMPPLLFLYNAHYILTKMYGGSPGGHP